MKTDQLSLRTTYFLTSSVHDEEFVRNNITELRTLIVEHNKRYYQTSDPVISDNEYDQLFTLLVERENGFPDLVVSDSPTQRLVGQVIEGFTSARHLAEMSSLQNTYSGDDIAKRDEGLRRIQQKQDIPNWTYIIEPKLDGMSVELVYEFGVFVRAVTRGDGEMGEDITEHARHLRGLPMKIFGLKEIEAIAFRGEIILPKEAFTRLEGIMTTGGGAFANARNATAGTLRQLDTSLVKKRGLGVMVYDILFVSSDIGCATAEEQFSLFRTWGLPILDWLPTYTSIEQVIEWCSSPMTKQQAEQQSIDLDGLVIKIQEFAIRSVFGSTNHHPKRAIAYKFPAQQGVTKLEEVSFQVGRTGILTPVAHLNPIQLSGVVISRASLHNRAFIQERGLYLGDRVCIQRSGEVIPYIVAGLPERRDGTEQEIKLPQVCPVCAHPVYLDDRALAIWCGNTTCDAQVKQRLEHAVSKGALDIAGLGPSIIETVVDAGLVHTVADLFVLCTLEKKQILRGLPGIAEKKIALLEKEIEQKSPYVLWRVINALGIRHIGEVSSRDIALNYFSSTQKEDRGTETFIAYCMQQELLESIHGFGKEMIASLQLFFHDHDNRELVFRLERYGVINREGEIEQMSELLDHMHIAVTGSFGVARESIVARLRGHGAVVQSTVTQQTTVLLAGEGGGSKRQIANHLGVPVMNPEEFMREYKLGSFLLDELPSSLPSSPAPQQTSLF